MTLLDQAGTVLPEGLEFLKPGWWMLHLLAAGLVFVYGYRRGRLAERREQRERARAQEVGRSGGEALPNRPGEAATPGTGVERSAAASGQERSAVRPPGSR
jgi:hypothetical protein